MTTAQQRLQSRTQAMVQAKILALMEQAVLRACKGVMPSPEELKEHALLFDNPKSGRMQLWWLGETVLLLTPSAEGLHWEFMGSAAQPLPQPQPAAGG